MSTRKPKEPTSLQRARKAHTDRLREQGFRPKTFWLSAGTIETLARLSKAGGTSEAATVAHALAKLDEAERSSTPIARQPKDGASPQKSPAKTARKTTDWVIDTERANRALQATAEPKTAGKLEKASEPKDKPASMGRLKGHWKAP